MEPDELAEWRAGFTTACIDCPVAFAEAQRSIGRCNGVPGELLAGAVTEEEPVEAPVQPDPGIRVAVTLEAPCGRCEKADVCSLRPAVEALTDLPVLVPVLDRRVGLELAGSVTCSAFVKARVRKADADELDAKPKRHISPAGREAMRQAAIARRARERAEREAVPA
jgi:hypothetical protein